MTALRFLTRTTRVLHKVPSRFIIVDIAGFGVYPIVEGKIIEDWSSLFFQTGILSIFTTLPRKNNSRRNGEHSARVVYAWGNTAVVHGTSNARRSAHFPTFCMMYDETPPCECQCGAPGDLHQFQPKDECCPSPYGKTVSRRHSAIE